METKTQLRGICPACFATQALRSNALVDHGYRRPQQWHQNVGTCTGTGQPHFGTEAGRDYTAFLAMKLRKNADVVETRAVDVVAGTESVLVRKRVATGVVMDVVKDDPTSYDRERYAEQLRAAAVSMRKSADEFDASVASWEAAEPTTATVATKKETLVHWRGGYWATRGGGKACAGSMMGSMKGYATSDLKSVTCEKCKAVAARNAERAAANV